MSLATITRESTPAVGGFVYCIKHHERNAVKIGFSKDPWKRLRQLQTGSSDMFTLFDKLPGDRALERAFHKVFEDRRLQGEWFDDTDHRITFQFGRMAWEARMAE